MTATNYSAELRSELAVDGEPRHSGLARFLPGLALSIVIAVAATALAHIEPVIGGPVFAIVLGMALAPLASRQKSLTPGIGFAGRGILQAAIVVLGTGLSVVQVLSTGARSLPVMLGTLVIALAGAWMFGRLFNVRGDLDTLIGVGTAICGASAVAATTAVIGAAEVDVAYAISTIFVFNVAAVLAYPSIGHLLGLSQHAFGLWSGTAINDVSSVVAAGYTYGHVAGSYAVVVKLTRTLMIIPICLGLAFWRARGPGQQNPSGVTTTLPWRRLVPWFIAWFILAVALNSVGLVPSSWHAHLSSLSTYLVTIALAAIGLSARFADMRRTGLRPLILGAALWATVGLTSLSLQALSGTL